MALASGMPVPPVYVLDHEPGINAFAAGHQPGDAVVAVSRGCLQYLTREELQGVLGHEFSHILNGDMRLNLRLIGIVFGILVLAIIGYYVMRSAGLLLLARFARERRRPPAASCSAWRYWSSGYLGVFLGKLIKSAISRQREFLADASSVQFTRNPGGIAGALKKIGGLAEGSRIRDGHAEEISHMFFGDAFAGTLFQSLRHASAAGRSESGRWSRSLTAVFPAVQPLAITAEAAAEPSPRRSARGLAAPPLRRLR